MTPIATDRLTVAALHDELNRMVGEAGSQNRLAEELGISSQYLNDVLWKRRQPGKKLLDALGLQRVIYFMRKKKR